jgi:tetratricopeptide (TPR) repeat protein
MNARRRHYRTLPRALAAGAVASALALAFGGCASARRADRPSPPPAAQERLDQADELAKDGRLNEALAQLALAIRDNPTLTPAYVQMGDIHRQQGNIAAAADDYGRASDLDPRNFQAAYGHGLMLQLLDRVTEAVNAYLRALSIRPDDREANLNLATAYLQLGEARQSLPYAERAVRIDPESGSSRVNLGAVYAALGRHEEAVAQYEAAADRLDLNKNPNLLLNLADSLGKINRHQEMANTLERLIQVQPTAQAYERLGAAQFRLRDYDAALASFTKATEVDPRHFPAFNGVGVCLLNMYLLGDQRDRAYRDQAMEALRTSLRINPSQPRIVELVSKYG